MKHPDYKGYRDEIVRLHIEAEFERKLKIKKCCGVEPQKWFKSDHDYFITCPVCGRKTKMYRKMYMVIQAWNKDVEENTNETEKSSN